MRNKILAVMLGTVMAMTMMTGCGNTQNPEAASSVSEEQKEDVAETEEAEPVVAEEKAVIEETYICGDPNASVVMGAQGTMEGAHVTYYLELLSDGTYRYTTTQCDNVHEDINMYAVTVTFGNYTKEDAEDGTTPIVLDNADRVIYNVYLNVGGVALSVDTDDASDFPAELLGSGVADQSAEDYLALYGAGTTVYVQDGSNFLYLTNPADQM